MMKYLWLVKFIIKKRSSVWLMFGESKSSDHLVMIFLLLGSGGDKGYYRTETENVDVYISPLVTLFL